MDEELQPASCTGVAARSDANGEDKGGLRAAASGLARLVIPTVGEDGEQARVGDRNGGDSPHTPTNPAGESVEWQAKLILPQSSFRTPTKVHGRDVAGKHPSWKRGSTGSPYNVQTGATTPSPAGRGVERCRMDVLSCSREASEWALEAWTTSASWRALCDVDHGQHKLIRVIMYDRQRVFPSGNPVVFDPQFIRTNCYFVVWNTAERSSMEQALADLKTIRQQQPNAVVLMMGCLLQRDTLDHTWDTDRHAANEKRNVEEMLGNEALVTGNLTMAFAKTTEDVEAYVLQLLFKSLQTKLDSSFFLQHQWIAAFYASVRILENIWSSLPRTDIDLESCVEALVSGLDLHLKHDLERELVDNYMSLLNTLVEQGAPLDTLGTLRGFHPKAVDELVFSLRCVENHSLDLSGLKLPAISPGRLTSVAELLHRVDVSRNCLERLPLQLFLLPNLTSLRASHNQLQFLPAFSRWRCAALQVLDVSHNQLICPLHSQDYNDFDQFTVIQADSAAASAMINKSMTFVTSTTASPAELKKGPNDLKTKLLSTFRGGGGGAAKQEQVKRTTCVPTGICTMKNLTSLNMRANRFEEVPAWVTVLPKLWSLDLRDNPRLHRLPPELARARGLFLLRVEGLMLTNPPARELERGSKAIVCYLRSQLKTSTSYRHMKLMVIGEMAAGKTTLLTYLTGDLSAANRTRQDQLLSTVGVSMGTYTCHQQQQQQQARGRKDAPQPVHFQTLDFAGQHEYDSTHQCFFSQRAVYLGVFDSTKGYDGIAALRPWLMSVHACAPGSPVILVGTHSDVAADMDDNDILAAAQQECGLGRPASASSVRGLPKIAGLYLVSGLTGAGTDELKDAIYAEAVELTDPRSIFKEPYVLQKVPGSYVELQQRLVNEAKELKERNSCPVIDHDQLLQVVKRAPPLDIEDSEELSQACRFLHDVGVLLHYEPPPTKSADSLYFIEPQWLSNALARIVTTRERSLAYRGLLSLGHLPLIFKDLLVPPSLYSGFMNLLETFEILVPLDKENTVYLVPALLPKQTEKLPILGAACCVARVYSLAFIPAGLWTRLIARLVAFFDLQPSSGARSDEDAGRVPGDGDDIARVERHLSAPSTPSTATGVAPPQQQKLRSLPTSPSLSDGSEDAMPLPTSANLIPVAGNDGGTSRLQEVLERRRKWHCWQNGGVFYLRENDSGANSTSSHQSMLDRSQAAPGARGTVSHEDNFIVAQEGRQSNELVLLVQSTDRQHAAQLLSHTVSQLDTLLDEWYPGLCEEPCRVEQFVPCPTCIRLASQMAAPPNTLVDCSHLFAMQECLEAVQGGLDSLPCPACSTEQKLEDIAPDLTLSDLPCEVTTGRDDRMLLDRDERNCLGRGAFGEVYAGFWKGAAAAIKIVLADGPTEEHLVGLYQVLRDEADILSHLDHPRILRLLGVCLSPSAVVLELAPLGTLRDAVRKRNGLPCSLVHRVVRQIAEGLQYLHDSNIIFRDLKPDNVLVWSLELPSVTAARPLSPVGAEAPSQSRTRLGSTAAVLAASGDSVCVKLADYSLAKYASSSGTLLQAKGTEGYMAPEVASGTMERRFAYDCKADVFALGVVLYECVVGERPFWKVGKWKFLELIEAGQCPSIRKGLEGCGDERSIDETAQVEEQDPLRMSSNSSDGVEKMRSLSELSSSDHDTVSLSSLYSLRSTSDPEDPDGVVKVSSLYSKAVFVKSKSDCSEDDRGGPEAAEQPEAEEVFDDETCVTVCIQPLLRQCLQPRAHLRPSAGDIAMVLGACHGAHDESDTAQLRCETGLMHFAPDVVQFVSGTRKIWSCASSEPRIACLTMPEMTVRSAHFTNPAIDEGEQHSPASRFSALACTPMPKRKGQRVSSGTLVWIATLSGHLLAFNADSMELEGHAKLPTTVVSICMLSNAVQKRRNSKESVLLAIGLADGRVAVVKASLRESRVKVALWEQLSVTDGNVGACAVTTMTLSSDRKTLWLAHGTKIVAADVAQLSHVRSWESGHRGDFRGAAVRCLCPVNLSGLDSFSLSVDAAAGSSAEAASECSPLPVLCSSARRCSTVRLWDKQGNLQAEIDCAESLPHSKHTRSKHAGHVTCMHCAGRHLWLGTRSGYTVALDLVSRKCTAVVHHHAYVTFIGAAHQAGNAKASVSSVVACGQPLHPSSAPAGSSAVASGVVQPGLVAASAGGGTVFVRLDLLQD